MRESDRIACYLTRATGPFPYRRYLCVVGVSWGLRELIGEADLVAVSASNYLTEVEIKISVADLRRDADKLKHRIQRTHPSPIVSAFYYAMPESIWQKVENSPPIPEHAGVIVVGDGPRARTQIVKAARRLNARALTDSEREQIARLGAMRYWTRLSHKLDADTVPA